MLSSVVEHMTWQKVASSVLQTFFRVQQETMAACLALKCYIHYLGRCHARALQSLYILLVTLSKMLMSLFMLLSVR